MNLLRFLTCGSVDDGKSTLIGRLLGDADLIRDDQLASLAEDSRRYGATSGQIDFALLLDGLKAEREQNITIDVAYRYFSTARRAFVVANSPGQEQYTRNMATAASICELAVLLVDARKGLLTQTLRHTMICSLFGIRHFVLAVNKIDLVGYGEDAFNRVVGAYKEYAHKLAQSTIVAIPLSARYGDNVVRRSRQTPWYTGPTFLEHIENIEVVSETVTKPFRMAVQWVNRANAEFRGFAGTVASGCVHAGDSVVVVRSGVRTKVDRIVSADGDLVEARAGDAVTLTLSDEIDVARGDMITVVDQPPQLADQFAAHLLWMGDEVLIPGRIYLMRIGTQWTSAAVSTIKHRLDTNNFAHIAGRTLQSNDIGFCNVSCSEAVVFDSYQDNRETGSFILVDQYNHRTVAAGMISFALRRALNVQRERLAIDQAMRAGMKSQRPYVLWFTGLPAAGKSTIAKLVDYRLHLGGYHTYMLDGDNLRQGLNRDLGFTASDRVENIRRAGEVAKLFIDAGLVVICSFISPFHAEREMVRNLFDARDFIEIFVDTPIDECIRRDPKGLYAKAQSGQIENFTGIGAPYEIPQHPDVTLQTLNKTPDELADQLMGFLRDRHHIR